MCPVYLLPVYLVCTRRAVTRGRVTRTEEPVGKAETRNAFPTFPAG